MNEFEKALDEALCKISGQSAYKHLVMTRYKDGIDLDYPTVTAKDFAVHIWHAACTSKQKEIENLQAQLREQHQNQLDLMEKIEELEKRLRLAALEKYETTPIDPEEVYSPNTKVINE